MSGGCEGRVEKPCEACGKVFSFQRARSRRFCGKKCAASTRKKEKVVVRCAFCADEFKTFPYRERTARTCSRRCRLALRAARLRSERRFSAKYKRWRKSVLLRDGRVCASCGRDRGKLEVDHLKPWAFFPEFRFLVENGRVLCKKCHGGVLKETFRWRRILHGGRAYVAVDLDGVLVDAAFSEEPPGPVGHRGLRLLEEVKKAGYSVLLFTGRISEDMSPLQRFHTLGVLETWVKDNGLSSLIYGVWPYPKPHVQAFVDDRGSRWRGDVDMALVDVRTSCDYVDGFKKKKEA